MVGGQLSDRDQGCATFRASRPRLIESLGGRSFRCAFLRSHGPAPPRFSTLSAILVTGLAFICYRATLLPGLDFGDTASFQTGAGSLSLTPRQAYPLYHGLGNLFIWIDGENPARTLNLASAVYASLASGATVWAGARIVNSTAAGLTAGMLLAFSYTFWSQAIIAEVYTLNLLILALCLCALLAWSSQPTFWRLAIFFAIYAVGFGNHLSLILSLPAFAIFLLFGSREGPKAVLQPRIILAALAIGALASLQYAWNARGLWQAELPPTTWNDALGRFWFDVTKSDWRQSLVLGVSKTGLSARPAMYWFDIRQQFGVVGAGAAALGAAYLPARAPGCAVLVGLIYVANVLFALTYNVGDMHVFLLPAHLATALFAGAAVACLQTAAARMAIRQAPIAALCLLYPLWRGYDTFPAVDRSDDHRPTAVLDDLTRGVSPENAVLGVDSNWQVQNAVEYYARHRRSDLAWFTSEEVRTHFPAFVRDNERIARSVLLTPLAWRRLADDRLVATEDRGRTFPSMRRIEGIPRGTTYALAVLEPTPEFPLDLQDLRSTSKRLSGGSAELMAERRYAVMIGRAGEPPRLQIAADAPFRVSTNVGELRIEARMESWLPTDTIRRAGFGHVIVNHRHALTIERGISFVALTAEGHPLIAAYAAGIFAAHPLYAVRTVRSRSGRN